MVHDEPLGDSAQNLVSVLNLVRLGHARTRSELAQRSGLGRTTVTQLLGYFPRPGFSQRR